MPEKQDTIFADGLFYELPVANAPTFVKGKLSIDVAKFIKFLNDHQNKGGYVNIDLKESKGGKGYAVLNSWKPTEKQYKAPKLTEEEQEAKESNQKINVQSDVEYPEEKINPNDIPF